MVDEVSLHQHPSNEGTVMSADALRHLARELDLSALIVRASVLRDQGHGTIQTFSPKVFIPLTHLCRDVCHDCTFAKPPRQGEAAYLTPDEVLSIAREGALAGCHEALFTLGDKPELRYQVAREQLALLGHENTISYLVEMCELVLKETGLLPHANPGVLAADEIAALRRVTTSQGIMLESAAKRLCQHGGPHFGSPDKEPAVRLETIRSAGEQAVPITSGILIGIGETREERIDALLALRSLHLEHGHIQEIIIQNFRAKPDTKMADAPEPDLNELMWTIAIARIAFGSTMNIQAPPNLSPNVFGRLIEAGINDWGGVSPVTLDHVNPEAPWPEVGMLAEATKEAGKTLVPRLAIYPEYVKNLERWQDDGVACHVRHVADADGFARPEAWSPGSLNPVPSNNVTDGPFVAESYGQIESILNRACDGIRLEEGDIARMFRARGEEVDLISQTADDLRRATVGNVVRYVVNRNINYTNVCYFRCQFCAFSKGKLSENLRGAPYDLALDEVTRRVQEAWERGATEVCMQGGIHPDYTGDTYLEICRAVRATVPDMHIHAFSPLEVHQGAETLGMPVSDFLESLREAGLDTLPGTAAEILDDSVRATLCPDKLNTASWLEVMEAAHRCGFRTTATIMFGHIDGPENWARHLLRIRDLQAKTGGFTEFVPLPFVHMEAPIYLKGKARRGPTWRETILMHAIARLSLHPLIPNIQVSWVKLGPCGASACLQTGANDLGGTLMNESISRAAGNEHGQEMGPAEMEHLIKAIDRTPEQRTTLYQVAPAGQRERSFGASPLAPMVQTPAGKYARTGTSSDVTVGAAG